MEKAAMVAVVVGSRVSARVVWVEEGLGEKEAGLFAVGHGDR